jgi:hypothetical protein
MGRSGGGADSGTGDGAVRDTDVATVRRRAAAISLALLLITALTALTAAGVWWITTRLATPTLTAAHDELTSLDAKLTEVRGAITPIAREFTAESATGTLDVAVYRERIDAARRVVDGVNGMDVSDPDAQEVRDLIVTGGSDVVAGMNAALDALASDDPSATVPAAAQVDDGLSILQQARDRLDLLLGTSSQTLLPDHRLRREGPGA